MTYNESKKILDSLRSKDEMLFRMGCSHLMDVGIRHLTDENVEATCVELMKQDDSHSFMTNRYQCDLVRMAAELAKIDHIHLLVYISENVFYDVGQNSISYDRAKDLLVNTINYALQDRETDIALEDLEYIGFEMDEIETLGFKDIFYVDDGDYEEEDN